MSPAASSATAAPAITMQSTKGITSFAMKEDSSSGSPNSCGLSLGGGGGGGASSEILVPKKLDDLMQILSSPTFSCIRYSAYRIASKLDTMRSAVCLDQVKLGAVTGVFNQHGYGGPQQPHGGNSSASGLGSSFASVDVMVDKQKAADMIADIFFSANKIRTYYMASLDVQACSQTTLQLALMIYGAGANSRSCLTADSHNSISSISVKALKVFCVLLCDAKLMDKLTYLFADFANSKTKLLSRRSLSALLRLVARFPEFLGESANFGSFLVEAAVAQCFQMYSCGSSHVVNVAAAAASKKTGINQEQFKSWMAKEPQVTVWLATFYRMVSSKSVRHVGVSCVVCKTSDICGLRYQCLRCINYDLCQRCFLHGKTSRSHKQSHPIQEYCTRSTRRDATRALLKLLINNLKRSRRRRSSGGGGDHHHNQAIRYLPHDVKFEARRSTLPQVAENAGNEGKGTLPELSTPRQQQLEAATATTAAVTPKMRQVKGRGEQAKLFNSIVLHLEEQNHQMMSKLQGTNEERSCAVMQQHLEKLRSLIDKVFTETDQPLPVEQPWTTLNMPSLIESTPLPHQTMQQMTQSKTNNRQPLKQQKILSRINLDKHFSPVVFKTPAAPKTVTSQGIKTVTSQGINETMEMEDQDDLFKSDSILVDTLLNGGGGSCDDVIDDEDDDVTSDDQVDGGESNAGGLSLRDLTSLLVKTGFQFKFDESCSNEVTEVLNDLGVSSSSSADLVSGDLDAADLGRSEDDLADEIESLMLRLESVFKSYHDKTIVSVHQKQTQKEFDDVIGGTGELQQIVAEIADQVQAFSLSLQRLPSVRSDGDGLSNPDLSIPPLPLPPPTTATAQQPPHAATTIVTTPAPEIELEMANDAS